MAHWPGKHGNLSFGLPASMLTNKACICNPSPGDEDKQIPGALCPA